MPRTEVSFLCFMKIPLESIQSYNFDQMISDLEFLAEMPIPEVRQDYESRRKSIDHSSLQRDIIVKLDSVVSYTELVYAITYRAHLKDDPKNSYVIGSVAYTSEEVAKLRRDTKKKQAD